MSESPAQDVGKRFQDLLKLRKRIGMSDAMFYTLLVPLAAECGVDNLLAVTPQEVRDLLGQWLPKDIDRLLPEPKLTPERDKELKETMKLLRQRCCLPRSTWGEGGLDQ